MLWNIKTNATRLALGQQRGERWWSKIQNECTTISDGMAEQMAQIRHQNWGCMEYQWRQKGYCIINEDKDDDSSRSDVDVILAHSCDCRLTSCCLMQLFVWL